ncbi:DMT family transporter [Aquabacterium sp. OR-4]|uniref:DMT family transporter n=1 Tax=Aquabacterium sp. OR-4 TaxID=2978127 RepID=UPI0021B3B8F5|nr:DMT family transporter [Aquabacterium sp. OR-4]MDT7836372.1 DMT family transporter [Aquabacterium sp. OR-4]
MQAVLFMVLAALLFSMMGVAVKLASASYSAPEIVFYRGLVGACTMWAWGRWHGVGMRTQVPGLHVWRSASGVSALLLWFSAIAVLPLATAVTLNYMSSVWMAVFVIASAAWRHSARLDARLLAAVAAGFAGVVLILQPTLNGYPVWGGVAGLASGMLSAMAYFQVTALGRAGEPESRVVFYFSICGAVAGAALVMLGQGWHAHSARGLGLLLATGLLATTAQLLMTRAYAIGRPLTNATLQYLGIVFSFGWGVMLFDDPVHAAALAGMGLIVCAGMAAARLRARPD